MLDLFHSPYEGAGTSDAGALDVTFQRATLDIARKIWPKGFMAKAKAPTDLASLTAAYKRDGIVTVSSLHCDATIFSEPGVNHYFRAWHDWQHIRLQAEFDRAGEERVHEAMREDLNAWFGSVPYSGETTGRARCHALLKCDNIGQLDHWERFGAPPTDQRAFACGWLAARGML